MTAAVEAASAPKPAAQVIPPRGKASAEINPAEEGQDELRQDVSEIKARLDRMEASLAAILAAVAPGNPPPA